ncbi:MAG: hypothetical protein ACREP6_04180 [Candidatus Binataceae bacterium]
MTLRLAVLWIHVSFGALWIGGSASFALAAAVLEKGGAERREFAIRAALPINRLNIVAAIVVILSGIANIYFAGRLRNYDFAPAFTHLLEAKIGIYILMVLALAGSLGAEFRLSRAYTKDNFGAVSVSANRLAKLYVFTAIMGVIALALGLWLAGS